MPSPAVSERLAAYLKKHNNFTLFMERIETVHSNVNELTSQLQGTEKELEKQRMQQRRVETQKSEAEKKFQRQKRYYDECTGVTSGQSTDNTSNVVYMKNEYTDPIVFQKKQKEIQDQYDQLKQEYYTKRESELVEERKSIQQKKSAFQSNKGEYVQSSMEKVSSGCASVIEGKKQEVLQYLSANMKIKNSETSQRVQAIIESQGISPEECGTSEKKLIENIIALKGTDSYTRTQKINLQDFKHYRSKVYDIEDFFTQYSSGSRYQSSFFYPVLGVTAVALMILFMIGFSPLFFLIPSSATLAGAGGAVARTIVRILGSLFVAAIIFAIAYGVVRLLGFETAALIIGGIAGVYFFVKFFVDYYPNITAQNMMGFGKVVHVILAVIINLIAVAIIIGIIYFVILNTPIANFFFKMENDVVENDLLEFEKYFMDHKNTYLAMFHYVDAIGYAIENKFRSLENKVSRNLKGITEDKEYLGLEAKCDAELSKRSNERDKQLNEIRKRRDEYKDEVEKEKRLLVNISNEIAEISSKITKLSAELKRQKNLEENLNVEIAESRKDLIEQTTLIMDKNDAEFEGKCARINTAQELLAGNGQLSKQIYFVRSKKDKYGMAELREMNISCQHTVFVYDNKDITGNNLSEELCHFIKWFTEAIRRTNPAAILHRWFTVIDVMSGQSVLTMPPYDRFISVVGDEKGKLALAGTLGEKEISITSEMNRSDIRKDGFKIDSIDSLNAIKMEINKPDIDQQPNIPIQDLWEKPVPYNILIFIVPEIIENGSQPSVLNDELKKILMNAEHYGIIPVFLVSNDTWQNTKNSADSAYLHNIQNKTVINVLKVGRNNEAFLDI